jgi:hypothetical protein
MRNEIAVVSDYLLSGAIVGLERNDRWISANVLPTARGKLHKVLNSRATKAIESLVIITHNTNLLMARREPENQLFLNRISVLIFIDNDVLEHVSSAILTCLSIEFFQRA